MDLPVGDALVQLSNLRAWNTAAYGGPNPELSRGLLNALPQGMQVMFLIAVHVAALYGVYKLLRLLFPGGRLHRTKGWVFGLAALGYMVAAYSVTRLGVAYPLILPLLAWPLQALLMARAITTGRVIRYGCLLGLVSALVFAVSWRFDIAAVIGLGLLGIWLSYGMELGPTRRAVWAGVWAGLVMLPLMSYWVGPKLYYRLMPGPPLAHDSQLDARLAREPVFYGAGRVGITGRLEQVPEVMRGLDGTGAPAVLLSGQLGAGDLLSPAEGEFFERLYRPDESALGDTRSVETIEVPASGTYRLDPPPAAPGYLEIDGARVQPPSVYLAAGKHTFSLGPETNSRQAYALSRLRSTPADPPRVTYRQLSPTAYSVRVHGGARSLLVMQQTFQPGWRAYLVRAVPDTPGAQLRRLFGLEREYRLPAGRHVVANGHFNAWWLEREAIPGDYLQPDGAYELVVEYWPQRLVLWGLVAGAATIALIIYVLYITRDRTRHRIYQIWD